MTGRIYGIVLAGGASSRMGRDKALVMLRGRPLLSWAAERLSPQCHAVVISRHGADLIDPAVDLPIVADDLPGRAGPLAGLLAGLDWIARADPGAAHAVTVAVDTPFLPRDLVERLRSARDAAGSTVACAASGERRHPVAALWPVAIRAELRAALVGEGLRRVALFLDRHAPAVARWEIDSSDPFLNVNTPADAAFAERVATQAAER